MQVETWEPTRRDKLRSEAFASTLYGQACREKRHEEMHRVLEERLQRGETIKLTAEDEAAHEAWRAKKGITRPPRREV